MTYRNRIQGLKTVKASQLVANPANWRIHPQQQREVLAGVLQDVGYVDAIKVVERDGKYMILDGHLRADLSGDDDVPVLVLELEEQEANLILTTFDAITGMAETDQVALDSLAHELNLDQSSVSEFLASLTSDDGKDDAAGDKGVGITDMSEELPGAKSLKTDMFFDSDLPWNMPELRADMLGDVEDEIRTWIGPKHADDSYTGQYLVLYNADSIRELPAERAILAFYVDDWRFNVWWEKPAEKTIQILNSGISTVVTHNFSLWAGQAKAVHLYNTYRARWLGRYMQEAGLRIIPDVNWCDEQSFEFCLLGIPKSPPVIAVQAQTLKTDDDFRWSAYGIKRATSELTPSKLLVYGSEGADKVLDTAEIDGKIKVVRVPTRVHEARMARMEGGD